MSAIIRNFALENNGERAANIHHIKVDWETRQFYVNYRDNLTSPMAGPIPYGTASGRGITKDGKTSNPVFSEFHRIL